MDVLANVRPGARLARLRLSAKQRGLAVELTLEQYTELIANSQCHYCGAAPPGTGHGIDRMDHRVGYILANVVVACDACNRIKGDVFSYEQMREIGSLLRVWRSEGRWKDPQRRDARRFGGRPIKGDLRREIEAWNRRWLGEASGESLRLPFGIGPDFGDGSDIVRERLGAYAVHARRAELPEELDDSRASAMGSVLAGSSLQTDRAFAGR